MTVWILSAAASLLPALWLVAAAAAVALWVWATLFVPAWAPAEAVRYLAVAAAVAAGFLRGAEAGGDLADARWSAAAAREKARIETLSRDAVAASRLAADRVAGARAEAEARLQKIVAAARARGEVCTIDLSGDDGF